MKIEKAIRAALVVLPMSSAHAQVSRTGPAAGSTCMSRAEPNSISDELERLATTVLESRSRQAKTPIPQDIVDRWLHGCSFDDAKRKLEQAGFQVAEENQIREAELERGIERVADAEKVMRLYRDPAGTPVAAFLAEMFLFLRASDGFHAEGYFYIDGP